MEQGLEGEVALPANVWTRFAAYCNSLEGPSYKVM